MTEAIIKRWYLIYSKPRQETLAQTNLQRQGYATYLPLVRQPRRRAGKRVQTVGPMFPRYLFINLDSQTDDWGPIRSTLGVVSLVRFGQRPVPVPERLLEALRAREDEKGLQVVPVDEYEAGTPVRITEGGLTGYEGIFLSRSGHERVTVLLDIMGKVARATVDAVAIEPAGSRNMP